MIEATAPYCMINDNAIMMIFVLNIIGVSYVFVMNGTGILERLKCMFYYESKSTPFNNRTHITTVCNALLYAQTLFYATIISAEFIIRSGYNVSGTILPLAGILALCFSVVLLFKRISYNIVNAILFSRQEVIEWRNAYFFTIKLLGFALAPAAIAILFLPGRFFNSVKIYLLFVLIAYVYMVFNSLIKIIFTQKRNYLDIFLYLCTLEFLPMGIVGRFILQMSEFLTIKN